jgi:hypothetical protein
MCLLGDLRSYRTRQGPRELISEAREIGERTQDDVVVAHADFYLGCVRGRWGDRAAIPAFDNALELARAMGHERLAAYVLGNRAIEAWYVGDLRSAVAMAREGVELSTALDDQYSLQLNLGMLGEALAMSGQVQEGRRLVHERLRLARLARLPLQAALALEQIAFLAPGNRAPEAAQLVGHTSAGYLLRSDEDLGRHEQTMAWLADALGHAGVGSAMDLGAELSQQAADALAADLAAADGPAPALHVVGA